MPQPPAEPRLPGPFGVGLYARKLADFMQDVARVRLIGEAVEIDRSARGDLYFELRDSDGAVPISMWGRDLARMHLAEDELREGALVIVAGGVEYYPGSATASPRFSFRASYLRLAGAGDLLARLEELRERLRAEGLFEPQKSLPLPALPKRIGVVCAEDGQARGDLVEALRRRGWGGELVYSFQPVQDSRAAPAIGAALRALAPHVDVIVITRGGGSLADLWAFCDEGLCRTVATLPTPVVSAIGHTADHVLLDDVAAVACGTPTHAAEAACRVDLALARAQVRRAAGRVESVAARIAHEPVALAARARRVERGARHGVSARGRVLLALARVPAEVQRAERSRVWQSLREMQASATRRLREQRAYQERIAGVVLARKADATARETAAARAELTRRAADLERAARLGAARARADLARTRVLLRAHEPERTLERGYALVEDGRGAPITTVAEARSAGHLAVRFADGSVRARVEAEEPGMLETEDR